MPDSSTDSTEEESSNEKPHNPQVEETKAPNWKKALAAFFIGAGLTWWLSEREKR